MGLKKWFSNSADSLSVKIGPKAQDVPNIDPCGNDYCGAIRLSGWIVNRFGAAFQSLVRAVHFLPILLNDGRMRIKAVSGYRAHGQSMLKALKTSR